MWGMYIYFYYLDPWGLRQIYESNMGKVHLVKVYLGVEYGLDEAHVIVLEGIVDT